MLRLSLRKGYVKNKSLLQLRYPKRADILNLKQHARSTKGIFVYFAKNPKASNKFEIVCDVKFDDDNSTENIKNKWSTKSIFQNDFAIDNDEQLESEELDST